MSTFFLFILSVTASSMSQYWQKKAAMHFEAYPELGALQKLLSLPLILSIFFLGISALAWLGVLSDWDVSIAYPLLSINFIVMLLLSRFIFNEAISVKQWLGISLIVFGVMILAGGETWLPQ